MVSNIVYFHPYLGMISNLTNIFQMGWNHQLDSAGDDQIEIADLFFLYTDFVAHKNS